MFRLLFAILCSSMPAPCPPYAAPPTVILPIWGMILFSSMVLRLGPIHTASYKCMGGYQSTSVEGVLFTEVLSFQLRSSLSGAV